MGGQRQAARQPTLYQINVSDGGVPKRAIASAKVTAKGVEGDRQRHLTVHGGADRAVCLFSWERIQALQKEGHSIVPGASGENLTVAGVDWDQMKPGDRVRIGSILVLELTSYTEPCRFNAQWFLCGNFNRINQKRHPGWSRLYARVLVEGEVKPGDAVVIEKQG
jgi:MOSC domain-containing protein YiiM